MASLWLISELVSPSRRSAAASRILSVRSTAVAGLVSLVAMGILAAESRSTFSPRALYLIHSIEYVFLIVNSRALIERMFSLLNTRSCIGTSWALPGQILPFASGRGGNAGDGLAGSPVSSSAGARYFNASARHWTSNCLVFIVCLLCGVVTKL